MFLVKEDFYSQVRQLRFEQMTEDLAPVYNAAITEAVAVVSNYLFYQFDTTTIFQQTGSNRNTLVLVWCKNVAIYILHNRLPNAMIPPVVDKNYDDTLKMLKDISTGKITPDLPKRTYDSDGDGTPDADTTIFRYGFTPKRSH